MTAGVPGSGIGGLFYLLSALLMPVNETVSVCRKTSSRKSRKVVCRQVLNAAGVMCGVWLTGWFVSRAILVVSSKFATGSGSSAVVCVKPGISLFHGLVTMLGVFLLVQVLSSVLRKVRPSR